MFPGDGYLEIAPLALAALIPITLVVVLLGNILEGQLRNRLKRKK